MIGELSIVTGPTVEPVTLAEVLTHCHADSGPEDDYIEDILIPAARLKAEEYQNRGYLSQSVKLIFDGYPSGQIQLPYSPVISITSVKYYDTDSTEAEIDTTDFDIDLNKDPAVMTLNYDSSYPTTLLRNQSGFEINYVAGYGTIASSVPAKVKMAILFLVGVWYTDRGMINEVPEPFYNILRPDRLRLKGEN